MRLLMNKNKLENIIRIILKKEGKIEMDYKILRNYVQDQCSKAGIKISRCF